MSDEDLDFGETIRGLIPGQKVFGRYTLGKILGRGGMGIVWKAYDETLQQDLAIKMLPEMVAADAGAVKDLQRETARSQRLSHPHILRIYDFAEEGRACGITMELVEGGNLTEARVEQPNEVFELAVLQPWVEQLCDALHYAHTRAKVVHRDLKPANLMLDTDGYLKIADFGIAASVSDSVSRVSQQAGSSGTPLYMSPQQMMGENPSVTDDIYALGATLFELLAGKPPFHTGNVMMQVLNKAAPSLNAQRRYIAEQNDRKVDDVPATWEETIAACLSKEPSDRPQTAKEVWQRLSGAAVESRKSKVESPESDAEPPPPPPVSEEPKVSLKPAPKPSKAAKHAASPEENQTKGAGKSGNSPVWWGILAVVLLSALGWWFGYEQPRRAEVAEKRAYEQRRIQSQLEEARKARDRAAEREEEWKQNSVKRYRPEVGQSFFVSGLDIEMLPIEPGTFMMGSPEDEPNRSSGETQHLVTLTQPYWMGATEVTQGQWEALMGNNPSKFKNAGRDAPVEWVSWEEAMAYCRKLTEREGAAGRLPEGYVYTLPTEAQWEYACRAGTTGAYAGDLDAMGWHDSNSDSTTHAVGRKRANAWGLYDMHGNVWEWCLESYGGHSGVNSNSTRALRGGSWGSAARSARSASSLTYSPDYRDGYLGFRVALTPSR